MWGQFWRKSVLTQVTTTGNREGLGCHSQCTSPLAPGVLLSLRPAGHSQTEELLRCHSSCLLWKWLLTWAWSTGSCWLYPWASLNSYTGFYIQEVFRICTVDGPVSEGNYGQEWNLAVVFPWALPKHTGTPTRNSLKQIPINSLTLCRCPWCWPVPACEW